MSSITQGGTLSYQNGRIRFQNVNELRMPFSGSIVVPKQPGQAVDLDAIALEDFLQVAVLCPQAANSGGRRFPSLRTMLGEVLTVTGSVIIFVGQDHFFGGNGLAPFIPEGLLGSSRPRFFVVTLDGNPVLPDLAATPRDSGFVVRTLISGLPATLSGTIMAFDYSGTEVDADAALEALAPTTIPGAPADTEVRVQLVDIWGNVLSPTDVPASTVSFLPPITAYDSARKVGTIQFTGTERKLQLTRAQSDLSSIDEAKRYLHRHIHVAVWPGHDGAFHEIDGAVTTFDLLEGMATSGKPPGFLRLCVYRPAQTMQNEVGGGINEDGVFEKSTPMVPANGLRFCAKRNNVAIFNHGLEFFSDFHAEVEAAQSGDELYLTNWRASAHLHLRGSMCAYGLGPADIDGDTVDAALAVIDQHHVLVPLGSDGSGFVLLADTGERGTELTVSFHAETRRLATPTSAAQKVDAGFVRAGTPFGLVLHSESGVIPPQEIVASWKNPLKQVETTTKTLSPASSPLSRHPFPASLIALGIDGQDPPQATVVRTGSYANLLTTLSQPSTAVLRLLIFNVAAGTGSVVNLNQGAADATNVVLGTLPETTTAEDTLVAAVISDMPAGAQAFADVLLTTFVALKYDVGDHAAASIPFAPEELGGVLRRAISRGVKVRAMFWEQGLENLGASSSLLAGHSNNVELAAVINREVGGQRGFAVLDRATRSFGSFHQKAAVLLRQRAGQKDAISWVGGIDLAIGRWDTEDHFTRDPDRQGSSWWDVQAKITGDGAIDVLRNFKHRWDALGHFIANEASFIDYVPRNRTPAIAAETQIPIVIPNQPQLNPVLEPDAIVQITRTFPPKSCYQELPTSLGFVGTGGELGALAAYKHAIASARRFILINDQYFFSLELALALHEALTKTDGPEFLVLMLPKDLAEQDAVDPMLFKLRQKALHVLFYGGTYTPPAGTGTPTLATPRCGRITANVPNSASPVLKKVAVLFARNRDGKPVYVHSKHMIVDDVWMTIGSSNVNFRSMTYDCELNVSIVGRQLFKGASGVVRSQRIEIARRMLGLPASYAPLIQDPTAMFAQFKALEAKDGSPAHALHPKAPMSQKLDPAYVKRITGDDAFNAGVDFVVDLPMNDPVITGVACNILDADGRSPTEPLAPLPTLVGLAHSPINAYGRLAITVGCQALVHNAINAGTNVFAEIRVTRTLTDPDGNAVVSGPNRTHRIPLEVVDSVVTLSPATGEIIIPLSTDDPVSIEARIIDNADSPLGCTGSVAVDPNIQTVLPGVFMDLSITMN